MYKKQLKSKDQIDMVTKVYYFEDILRQVVISYYKNWLLTLTLKSRAPAHPGPAIYYALLVGISM